MSDPDDIVAALYEIGGRRDTHDARPVRRSELQPSDEHGPVTEAEARRAYRQRVQQRASRRGSHR